MSAEAKEMHKQKSNLMLELKYTIHGRRQRGQGAPRFSYMVQNICSTDIVDRGLIVLFLGLFFIFLSLFPLPSPLGDV